MKKTAFEGIENLHLDFDDFRKGDVGERGQIGRLSTARRATQNITKTHTTR